MIFCCVRYWWCKMVFDVMLLLLLSSGPNMTVKQNRHKSNANTTHTRHTTVSFVTHKVFIRHRNILKQWRKNKRERIRHKCVWMDCGLGCCFCCNSFNNTLMTVTNHIENIITIRPNARFKWKFHFTDTTKLECIVCWLFYWAWLQSNDEIKTNHKIFRRCITFKMYSIFRCLFAVCRHGTVL